MIKNKLLMIEPLQILIFILIATFLSIIINGYYYGVSDQFVYIPLLHKILNPELFSKDLLFEQPQDKYSLFLPLLALFAKIFGLQWSFFLGQILTIFSILLAVYYLAYIITEKKGAAYLSILLLLISYPVAGTGTSTIENYFVLRCISLPFALGSVAAFIKKQFLLSGILAGVCFLIHPMTALAPIMILFCYLLLNIKQIGVKTFIKIAGVFILIISPLLIQVLIFSSASGKSSIWASMSADWLNILKIRQSYLFPSTWAQAAWQKFTWVKPFSYVAIFILTLILKFILKRKNPTAIIFDDKDARVAYVFLISSAFLPLAYLFCELFPLSLMIQFQIARGLYLIYFISIIYAVGLFWHFLEKIPIPQWFIYLLIIAFFLSTRIQLFLSPDKFINRVNLPEKVPLNPWIELQSWAEQNTPINSLFLVPPQAVGFRVYSKRSIVGDWKDGAPGMYSEEYAKKWWDRMNVLKNYDNFQEADFLEVAKKYDATHIITNSDSELSLPKVYSNKKFSLYKVSL